MRSQLTANSSQLPWILLVAISCWLLVPLSTNAYVFTRDLQLDDAGEDVRALQRALNADARTRVAESGPGSPASETSFFGEKTRSAVIRYQNLHAQDILVPLGLFEGTGYVGASTRQHLNGSNNAETAGYNDLSQAIAAFDGALGGVQPVEADDPLSEGDDMRTEEGKELFLDAVRSGLAASGVPQDRIDVIEESIEDQSERSMTDLVDEFAEGRSRFDAATRTVEQIQRDAETIAPLAQTQTESEGRFARLFQWLDGLNPVSVQKAQALVLQPVGGRVLYPYLCTCSFTWLILLGPPSVGLVDYETGTQGFLFYNLPFARYLVGLSTRVPVCYVYVPPYECFPIVSTYGLLTPIVGSSLF